MTWETKDKTDQQVDDGEILTPDGQQILVGSSEDEVLVYYAGYDNWSLTGKQAASWSNKTKQSSSWSSKSKETTSWSNKTKTVQESEDEEITTPDGQQILVGESEDQVLVYVLGVDTWTVKSKQAGSWDTMTKQSASWSAKEKQSAVWTVKSKTEAESGYILTPDGIEILVGQNEDQVLVYDDTIGWQGLARTSGSWSEKTKTLAETVSQKILTPDGNRVLLGAGQALVLVYRRATDGWTLKDKTES